MFIMEGSSTKDRKYMQRDTVVEHIHGKSPRVTPRKGRRMQLKWRVMCF
jgi:hypothetical protein